MYTYEVVPLLARNMILTISESHFDVYFTSFSLLSYFVGSSTAEEHFVHNFQKIKRKKEKGIYK